MSRLARLLAGLLVAVSSLWTGAEAASSTPATPTAILAAAPAPDWVALDPADLLVVDLQGGARVVIALADTFAPVHVANIRRLAPEHWYDGLAVLNPDTGSGAELYAVISQPIRALDRNIALVGRVVGGMEALSSLPRGTGDLGFYTEASQRRPIRQVRLGSDLPAAEQPHLQRLRPDSPTYRTWVQARANRQDSFFLRLAGAVDVCSALPPVRAQPQ